MTHWEVFFFEDDDEETAGNACDCEIGKDHFTDGEIFQEEE